MNCMRHLPQKCQSSFWKTWKNTFSPTIDKQIYVDGIVDESFINFIADIFSSFFAARSSSFRKTGSDFKVTV